MEFDPTGIEVQMAADDARASLSDLLGIAVWILVLLFLAALVARFSPLDFAQSILFVAVIFAVQRTLRVLTGFRKDLLRRRMARYLNEIMDSIEFHDADEFESEDETEDEAPRTLRIHKGGRKKGK